MSGTSGQNSSRAKDNQNIQVFCRVRPLNAREHGIRSHEVIDVTSSKEIVARQMPVSKKFTFDRTFGPDSKQSDVYQHVVAPLIEEVLAGYNCTVFAYGQTGTGKTHTMIGTECPELKSSWEDESEIGIIPRALSHLFDELRLMEVEFSMRISYLELYNEELCDLLSSDETTKIRIFDDSQKKGSVIIQGLEEIPVHSKNDVYKLLEKGKERRKTATTLMNAQSSRSHTVFSILVHIKENGIDGEEMLKIGKLNLVDLGGSENISKAGNEKGIRTRETVNINQSLLTLGRVITALVERTPHIPYRESKLTRLLQESLGGRTKTSIIATISPGHKDLEETLSTLEYAHRAKNIQNKPEVNQKLTKKTVLKEYTDEIDRLKKDLMAARDRNGIYLAEETYSDIQYKLDSQNKELNEKVLLLKSVKDELANKEKLFNEVSLNLIETTEELKSTKNNLAVTETVLVNTKTGLKETKKTLKTTKKHYKEKKHLLAKHIKTEEELVSQATKLIEVAEVATVDVDKLHNTIDRRKNVDIQIETTCDQFENSMKNSFDEMNNNLEHLHNKHNTHSQIISDEIAQFSKNHQNLTTQSVEKINSILKYNNISKNAINEICDKYESLTNEKTSSYHELFNLMISETRNKQNEITTNLEMKINELSDLIKGQNLLIEKSSENVIQQINNVHKSTNEITTNLEAISKISNNLKLQMENEYRKFETYLQEQDLIENRRKEIENELKQLNEERENKLRNLKDTRENWFTDYVKIPVNIETELKSANHLNTNSINLIENIKNKVESFKTTSNDLHAKKIMKITSLDEFVKDGNSYNLDKFDIIEKSINEHLKNTKEINEDCRKDVCEKNEEILNQIQKDGSATIDLIEIENKTVKGYQTRVHALYRSLQNDVKEYSDKYHQELSICTNQLEQFRKDELKTYSSTGETPSRKEYSYPRVLAITSPHEQLIRKFRLENDWSDVDANSTINEDSETTLLDISNDTFLENSTPKPNHNSTKLSELKVDFNFKIPQAMELADKSTSSKNSSALYTNENKENFCNK